jgi:hypothetical protein
MRGQHRHGEWRCCRVVSHIIIIRIPTYATLTNEIVGTGYTAGGATLAGKASCYVDATTVMLDANDYFMGAGGNVDKCKVCSLL